jgi:hypothetical protein
MSIRKPPRKLGVEALLKKRDPVSIQEITLQDWYAAFALINMTKDDNTYQEIAATAWEISDAMMEERNRRL